MQIRIGFTNVPRELSISADITLDELHQRMDDESTTLTLTDNEGHTIIAQRSTIAYVEVTEVEPRRVGFGLA